MPLAHRPLSYVTRAFAAAACVCALAACGGAELGGTPSDAAQRAYADAMRQLADGALLEAEQAFLRLTRLPSYLPVVALARLRLADTQYEAGRFDEAIDTYLTFIQRHEGNDNVAYAQFMVAKAHVQLMPSDLWILPPVHEMDLSSVVTARQQIERFLRSWPRSRYATEAIALRAHCLSVLNAHTDYVVRFYRERRAWSGVVFRLHQVLASADVSGHTLERYALLAESYEGLKWRQRAVDMWVAIGARWPDSAEARASTGHVQRLRAAIAEAARRGEEAEMPKDLPPMASIKPETLRPDAPPGA